MIQEVLQDCLRENRFVIYPIYLKFFKNTGWNYTSIGNMLMVSKDFISKNIRTYINFFVRRVNDECHKSMLKYSKGWMEISSVKCGRSVKILFFALSFLAVAELWGPIPVRAANLTVDTSVGNSPYNLTTNASYDNESVGISLKGGILYQTGYSNTVYTALNVGAQYSAIGTYNLGGTGSLNVAITSGPAAWEYVGVSGGTGTFNQTGGTNNMPGGILFVGSDVLGSGKGGTGTFNLSGGTINSTRNGPGTGAEAIGDSGGIGTFNQTGGTNSCNNGVFIGSDTEWVYSDYKIVHTGATGVYNLSGASSILITSGAIAGNARGGEVVGDGGGTGTFNQTGGTNIATNGGLAVGADIYGSGVGGVGTFNLYGGSLSASGLSEEIAGFQTEGGELIGTSRGYGTFNQFSGTNTVQNGLFIGSNINYSLSKGTTYTGGTGVYNLNGGTLSATGNWTSGSTVFAPGEAIGVGGGTGTFNQTGGTNTVVGGLDVGTNYSGTGKGTYNLSGGTLSATGNGIPGSADFMPGELIGDGGGTGTFNQTGGTNTVVGGTSTITGGLYVGSDIFGNGKAGIGTYNLYDGNLQALGTNAGFSWEYIGVSGGTGTFNQTGGTNTVTGGSMFVGSDVFVTGKASTGIYNLSGGTIVATRLLEASGAELIGDSGGIGTFNQTGGSNLCNNGVFIGSDASWRYSKKLVKGSIGIYNLSGGILNTGGNAVAGFSGGDGGEVVGDAGGTGTFNQTGGTNNAMDGGLAVGSDIYGAGVGGVGTFNLSGGSLAASGLTGSVGGEVIGTCQGTGTFNQTGGTNTVLVGLFVGSQVTYPLAPTKNISPGTGTYNLSGGFLTASGSGTWGEAGFIPGEDIGDAGSTGTFTQTGGVNTVSNGLVLGTDLFDSISSGKGTGTYNLSGGVLQADFEWVGGAGAGTFIQNGGSNTVTGNNAQYGIEMNGGTYSLNGGTLSTNSIDGNLDNEGGVFIPSKAGSIFTGNYTQGKNSALQIGIASSSNYNWLDMSNTGTVTFNGGTIEPVLQSGFVPTPGQTFDVIKNAQSITGTPEVANFTATLVGIAGTIADPGITISAARNYTNSVLTLTQNQRQVGNILNDVSATTTGDIGTVLHTIDSIPTSQANSVAKAYQQISPDMAASLANLGFAASTFFQQDINERITSDRYASLTGESTGFYGPNETKKVNSWNFYTDPQVFWGSQDSTANETGYNFSIIGLTVGADYKVRKDLLVGIASGYAHTYAGFNNNMGNVQNETVPVILYAAYFPGKFYAFGSAGYTVNFFNTNRQISFINRTATGSTTGNMLNSYGEAGYDLRVGNVVITPMASLAYSSIWINGFGETGANSLDLQVGSQHAESLQFSPGVRFASTIKYGKALLKFKLYANYAHEFANDSRNIFASLAQVGIPFNFQSQQLGRDFEILGANINVYSGKNFSVRLDSNTEIGRDNYSTSMVDAKLSFRF